VGVAWRSKLDVFEVVEVVELELEGGGGDQVEVEVVCGGGS
jgi:hypothetical protein